MPRRRAKTTTKRPVLRPHPIPMVKLFSLPMKSKGKRSGFCPTTTYGNRPISTAMARDAQNLHFCRPPPIVASAQPQIGPESHFLLHTLSFVHKEEANQSGSVCRVAPRSQLVTAWSTTMGKAPTVPRFPRQTMSFRRFRPQAQLFPCIHTQTKQKHAQ